MKKAFTLIGIIILFCKGLFAQMPQYAYTTGSTTVDWANVVGYPFSSGLNKSQWLYQSSMFATAPSGNVTKLYFRSATGATRTLTDLTIRMAATTLTELPSSLTFETSGFVTVFQAVSHTVTVVSGQWFEIALQTPFPYTAGQNFIVEISKTATTGQILAAYMPETYRGHVGATTHNALVGNTSLQKVGQLGMDISPSATITINGPDSLCLGSTGTFFGTPAGGTWSSSNTSVASINATGTVSALAVGNSVITYTVSGSSQTKTVYVNAPVNPSITLAATPNDTICEGSSITLTATVNNAGSNPFYAWKINGNATPLPNNLPTLSYTPSILGISNVRVIVTSSSACSGIDSVEIPIYVEAASTPSVAISANPSGAVCPGTSITFTAIPTNGGTTPTYQWKKNGNNVGTNSSTYTDATLTSTDVVLCQMTTSLSSPCISSTPVSSNQLSISFLPEVEAGIDISLDQTLLCEGSPVTATVVPVNEGTTPVYEWYINNTLLTGVSGTTHTFTPANGDAIYCVLTSNAICVNNPVVHSDTLNVTVNPLPNPIVTLNNGVLSSSIATGNQWYKDGAAISGATNQTYTPTANGAYHVVVTDANGCIDTSNVANYQTTSINPFNIAKNALKIYPNPANDILKIENNSNLKMKMISITNILGQMVYKEQNLIANKHQINIISLPAGIYHVKVLYDEGEVNTKLNVLR